MRILYRNNFNYVKEYDKLLAMKVIVIGAGASGVVAAINYKRHHFSDDVLVVEHLDKPLKKILATGNGKCNLGNAKLDFSRFNNPEFAKTIIQNYDYKKLFDSVSIQTKLIDEYAYPVSESAISVREALLNECAKLNIKFALEEKLIDYEKNDIIRVITNKKTYTCDKLIVSCGLCSSPKLGSDGSILKVLQKHGYKIEEPKPGLSPLYTLEKTKLIDGVRVKALVKIIENNKVIHEELGEVLFKEHGLSGIVIFNAMSIIARNYGTKQKIVLDLLPDFSNSYLEEYKKSHSFNEFLQAFINPKISLYLKDRFVKEDLIFNSIKNLEFTFDKSYGFEFSQVSVGGLLVSEIGENMMSKREKNVYFIGELLNIDGPCGGYNLTWAFASALRIK